MARRAELRLVAVRVQGRGSAGVWVFTKEGAAGALAVLI
jgi:hypothetical protein